MKKMSFDAGRQRGFSMIEMVIVVVVMLVIMSIGVNWVMGLAKDSRRAQDSDQLAKELNLIGKATKAYLVAADPAAYPLNTSVNIPVATLVSGGFLPTDFAARMGAGTGAVSPLAQPYMVVARRIVAGEPPTAVVSESASPLSAKLARIGVEETDPAILAFKQNVAAQSGRDYKTIAATIPKASRTATGVGNSFTKDLTAYFAAGFTQASAVALVNFKDLEPGGGGEGGTPFPPPATYSGCRVVQGQLTGANTTFFTNVCRADQGWSIVGSDDMNVCGGQGRITVLPFGGSLTSGLDLSYLSWLYTAGSECSSDYDATNSRCRHKVGNTYGVITMNSVTIDSKLCTRAYYTPAGAFREDHTIQADYNVCCRVGGG